MWWLLGCLVSALWFVWLYRNASDKVDDKSSFDDGVTIGAITFFGVVICALFFVIGVTEILPNENKPEPTAIEVYRGNTTLEITYKDSIAIDSVVVWKLHLQ